MSDFDLESFKKAFQNWPQAVEAAQEIERLQEEVERRRMGHFSWQAQAEVDAKEIESLTKEQESWEKTAVQAQDKWRKLEAENAELKEEVEQLRSNKIFEGMCREVARHKDKVKDLTQKLVDAEEERAGHIEQIKKLEADLDEQDTENAKLKERVEELEFLLADSRIQAKLNKENPF